ncbi:MAG: M23 family metallopeptidase [Clostridiales bacterium]|nr:M23 family metallopeptidase [Clostridiales bacterium]
MRRGRRSLPKQDNKFKYLLYVSGASLIVIIVSFIITSIVYNNNLEKYSSSGLTSEQMASLVPNLENDTEEASSTIGKNINEVIEEIEEVEENVLFEETENLLPTNSEKIENTEEVSKVVEEVIPDPTFIKPVEGELIKEFAKDNLVYSQTLDEWITHFGIDIKADRTTVVKASAPGIVKAIKNDPRYGLTIILEHVNGFKTVYSNLLSTEFVTEGETVEQGQSLGTVGNSAAFEIADEPHLHFEIIKNEEYLDPTLYF